MRGRERLKEARQTAPQTEDEEGLGKRLFAKDVRKILENQQGWRIPGAGGGENHGDL